MKKIKVLLITIILLSAGTFVQQAVAQETTTKTEQDKKKESELQESIALQKKAMAEQKKANADQKKVQAELEALRKAQEAVAADVAVDSEIETIEGPEVKVFTSRGGRLSGTRSFSSAGSEPFAFTYSGGDYFGHAFGGDEERTTWDFSKSVKESTFARDYSFDIEKTVNQVVLSVNGDCKAGEIRIQIVMPNGKDYSNIVIDELGNLNMRKSFSISETENQDKAGEWKFKISSTKATGYFKISLQTF